MDTLFGAKQEMDPSNKHEKVIITRIHYILMPNLCQ